MNMKLYSSILCRFWFLVIVEGYVFAYDSRCPVGLPFTVRPFNEKCYQFVEEEKYWDAARDYCVWHGGKLVKISNSNTNRFLKSYLGALHWLNNGVWIGLHDIRREKAWEWVTEKAGVHERMTYSNWGHGHPGAFLSGLRDCARMVRKDSWRWHETFCHALNWKYRFICEYEMKETTTTSTTTTTTEYVPPIVLRHVQKMHHLPPPKSDSHKHDSVSTTDEQTTISDQPEVFKFAASKKRLESEDRDQNTGVLAGIVTCCGLVIIFVVIIVLLLIRRRRRQKSNEDEGATARFSNPVYAAGQSRLQSQSAQAACLADTCENQVLLNDENCVDISGLKTKKAENEYVYHSCKLGSGRPTANEKCKDLESDDDDDDLDKINPKISEVLDEGYEVPKSTNHYLPMDGFNGSLNSLPNIEGSVYDQPKPTNIYAEIPGAEEYGNIYETLESVQDKVASQFNNDGLYMNPNTAVETPQV